MNKQMLFGLPIGTRVRIGDREGILTNASAMEVFKTYEITFDDGSVITRDELVDKDKKEWELVPSEELKETLKKKDWYKSEMEATRKDVMTLKTAGDELANTANELRRNNIDLIERLKTAVDKVQALTIENVKLTKRLEELTGSDPIVIEKGEVKSDGPEKFTGLGIDHSRYIYSAGYPDPIGAPVKLATEIAKVLNKENIEKILKEAGGRAKVSMIAEATKSSAKAVYRFISKTTGMFVGSLPAPDFKEENAIAWLEGQQGDSEPETQGSPDARDVSDDSESSSESGVSTDDEGNDNGSEDKQGGSWRKP